jgi:hypothetical protein
MIPDGDEQQASLPASSTASATGPPVQVIRGQDVAALRAGRMAPFWAIEEERLSLTRDHVFEVDVMEQHGSALDDRYASI